MIDGSFILPLATNWSTISSLATGFGTLVLALATFASVRSSNRSARVAEEALMEQRQPVFASSRFDDPTQKVMFVERTWFRIEGGRSVAQYTNGNVYLAISLRNVGAGIGVCQAWAVTSGIQSIGLSPHPRPDSAFRPQTRDLYIPAGDIGIWQGAVREIDDPDYGDVVHGIEAREPLSVELLYSDQVGAQRTITRFALVPAGDDSWVALSNRHWFLDRPGPRGDDPRIQERAETIFRSVEAAQAEAAAEARAAQSDSDEQGGSSGDGDESGSYSSPGSSSPGSSPPSGA